MRFAGAGRQLCLLPLLLLAAAPCCTGSSSSSSGSSSSISSSSSSSSSSAPPLQDLFTSATANGAATGNPWVAKGTPVTYRIPALVATNTTVIAFASERLGSANDESATNLVQRRSTDGASGRAVGPCVVSLSCIVASLSKSG
eukprot:COSAG06_NODE_7169_length_2600_cov_13.115954_2_plen_143_part_00